jgi:hypothetical protein
MASIFSVLSITISLLVVSKGANSRVKSGVSYNILNGIFP